MSPERKPCELPCPKCGHDDVLRTFRAKGSRWSISDYGVTSNRFAFAQSYQAESQRDHIDHHCRCCSYEWQTPPLRRERKEAS